MGQYNDGAIYGDIHVRILFCIFFFFNDTATTEIYTLSLHDALPISSRPARATGAGRDTRTRVLLRLEADALQESCPFQRLRLDELPEPFRGAGLRIEAGDRKSTRLNSSHPSISYAVFCLKKKKKKIS